MMGDGDAKCQCVVDTNGLHEIACEMTGNLKAVFLDHLAKGVIAVPTSVWQEFQVAYEEEAAEIESHIAVKINNKKAYNVGAASIADKIKSRLSQGPYDRNADLYAASISKKEKYTLLTTQAQISRYKKMGCRVSELAAWAEAQALR